MKVYVETGQNKKVVNANSIPEGVQKVLRNICMDGGSLGLLTLASDYGFHDDMRKVEAKEQIDRSMVICTGTVLHQIGLEEEAALLDQIKNKLMEENDELPPLS